MQYPPSFLALQSIRDPMQPAAVSTTYSSCWRTSSAKVAGMKVLPSLNPSPNPSSSQPARRTALPLRVVHAIYNMVSVGIVRGHCDWLVVGEGLDAPRQGVPAVRQGLKRG